MARTQPCREASPLGTTTPAHSQEEAHGGAARPEAECRRQPQLPPQPPALARGGSRGVASSGTISMATSVTSPRPFPPRPLMLARPSQWAQLCPITAGSPAPFPNLLSLPPRPLPVFRHSQPNLESLAVSIGFCCQQGADPGCYINGRRRGAAPDCSRVFSVLLVLLSPWQPLSARSEPSARPRSGPAPAACTSAHPGRAWLSPAYGTATIGMNGADPQRPYRALQADEIPLPPCVGPGGVRGAGVGTGAGVRKLVSKGCLTAEPPRCVVAMRFARSLLQRRGRHR